MMESSIKVNAKILKPLKNFTGFRRIYFETRFDVASYNCDNVLTQKLPKLVVAKRGIVLGVSIVFLKTIFKIFKNVLKNFLGKNRFRR